MEAPFKKVVPRNSLVVTCEYSKLCAKIVEHVKVEFENLDLKTIRSDPLNVIIFIADLVEFAFDEKLISRKVGKKVNKSQLVVDVLKCLFADLSESEIQTFENLLQFAIDSKLIRKKSRFSKCLGFLSRGLALLHK